ncbi:MAG: hypothetical protein HZB26_04315 [Candidatus Hydrogenedentes bacterium]|nr:hypothetical protein [Candidatus Hydrogenedentota bacterium]
MLPSETFLARLLAAAMIVLCARCDNPVRYRASLPLDHDAAAPHTIEDLWHESGAYKTLGPSPKGALSERAVSNLEEDFRKFRMALMIYTDDGKKVMDFFEGIPASTDNFVGTGDVRLRVPTLWPIHVTDGRKMLASQEAPTVLNRSLVTLARFAELFPDHIGTEFALTFKEFSGHAYCLNNIPKGTAFVWFQTVFDGNRIMQFPTEVRLEPKNGDVVRQDIHVSEFPFSEL